MRAIWNFIVGLVQRLLGNRLTRVPQLPPATEPTVPDVTPDPVPTPMPGIDFDRRGTFVIADIYPPDLGPNPNYAALVGRTVSTRRSDGRMNDVEFVGCVLKAGEGTGWGAANDAWFVRNYRALKVVGGDRYGRDWFRGAYYFLRLSVNGALQADIFCDALERAGGFDDGTLMPWCDVEEGGQGSWAGGEKLDQIGDSVKRARLAGEARACITAFISRFKERTGMRIAVYGRNLFQDLGMRDCDFGEDAWVNPAYTRTIVPMDNMGVPNTGDRMPLWQLCGDGDAFADGFPRGHIEGWGAEDYSVYIDGVKPTDLKGFRRHNLAKKP